MEGQISIPSQPGQICKIINPLDEEEFNDVYIVSEDPRPFDNDDTVYVVALKELQRNIKNPQSAVRLPVAKNGLAVIAENIDNYIKNWNDH